MSFWATNYMAEEESEGLDGMGPEGESLQDHITHWMEVLDRWVKRVDSGLDGSSTTGGDRGESQLLQMDDGDDLVKGV